MLFSAFWYIAYNCGVHCMIDPQSGDLVTERMQLSFVMEPKEGPIVLTPRLCEGDCLTVSGSL